jgi:cholesterol transport system auxiliary component
MGVGFICLLLGGCAMAGLGGGSSAPATYNISAPKVSAVQSSRLGRQVTVSAPTAIRALDTDRIMVSASGGRISYYGDSAWSDRLPRLLQSRIVEAMQDSGAFKAVLTSQDRVDGDFAVATEIRAFQLDVDNGSSSANVAIFCKIVDERHGRVIATREFSARTPAPRDDPAAAVAALQESFDRVTNEMVRWVAVPRSNSGA